MGGKTAAALALLALVAAGCGGSGKPHFRSATGWHLLSGPNELAAANLQFAAADRSMSSPPSRTVASLPRNGIVIWAMVSHSGQASPGWSTPLPLRLRETVPSNPFEGFRCAPAVATDKCYAASGSIRHLQAWNGAYALDLYVFFGTDHPATGSVAAANDELARLQLPREGSTTTPPPVCVPPNGGGAYDARLSPSSGPPRSTVTVSGPLGVLTEDGTYGGQMARGVHAYWNLNFHRWWSALESTPLAARAGSPVKLLARENVARRCTYRLRVRVPSVQPGRYPIVVLSGTGKSQSSFPPVTFRVTAR